MKPVAAVAAPRRRATTSFAGGAPLRVHRTPVEHIDTCVISEDDHHPWEHDVEQGQRLSTHDEETHGDSPATSVTAIDRDQSATEKDATSRRRGAGISQSQSSSNNISAEEREWKDDVVTFDTRDDPANPKNWSQRRKISATFLYGLSTMCATFASSVFSSAANYVRTEFNLSQEVTILGLSLFVAGYIVGPLLWAPFSEMYGRKMSIVVPMFVFMCFSAGTATAKDVQTIFITRFFGGVFACAPVTTVGGGLADMFDQKERGTAVVFYSLAVVAGPTLGPVIGGAVSQSYLGWRWTEYLTVILIAFVIVLDVLFLPETYAPVLLTRKAKALRLKTGRWSLHSRQEMQDFTLRSFLQKTLFLPVKMIFTEPIVTALVVYNSFAYGILYMLFAAIPILFEETRGWNTLVGSLPFLAVLIGTFVAAAINIAYSQTIFQRKLKENGGRAPPEARLIPAMLGGVLFPVAFFLVGWTSFERVFWLPEVIGLGLLGTSFLLVFQSSINYLIDSYTSRSVSAVAANTFLRSVFAAGLPLVAPPLFHNLGNQWACTLLGCIAVLLAFLPFIFYFKGPYLRSKSKLIDEQ